MDYGEGMTASEIDSEYRITIDDAVLADAGLREGDTLEIASVEPGRIVLVSPAAVERHHGGDATSSR